MATKILLVEDNLDSCAYLARLLELKGYDVHTATDGIEALKAVEAFHPDLIITNIMMPRLDGIGLLNTIRNSPNYRSTPVIAMSAFGSGNLQAALQAGANKALRKPINFEQFFKSIEQLLLPA